MKTVTLSNRFYYHELDEKDASAIKNDLVLYNSMLHKAYKYLSLKNKGVYIKSNEINKELKHLYGTNDYFPLSCVWKAQHLLKANIEHHQLWLKQSKADAEKRRWHIKKSIQLIPVGSQEKNTRSLWGAVSIWQHLM